MSFIIQFVSVVYCRKKDFNEHSIRFRCSLFSFSSHLMSDVFFSVTWHFCEWNTFKTKFEHQTNRYFFIHMTGTTFISFNIDFLNGFNLKQKMDLSRQSSNIFIFFKYITTKNIKQTISRIISIGYFAQKMSICLRRKGDQTSNHGIVLNLVMAIIPMDIGHTHNDWAFNEYKFDIECSLSLIHFNRRK